MLSFIYRLVELYDTQHGYHPNVVYLNSDHLKRLCEDLGGLESGELVNQLGLQVLLRSDAVHPQVGWMQAANRAVG